MVPKLRGVEAEERGNKTEEKWWAIQEGKGWMGNRDF